MIRSKEDFPDDQTYKMSQHTSGLSRLRENEGKNNALTPTYSNLGPLTREGFATQLSEAFRYKSNRYISHSFRIGAGSYAAERGMCDAQIRTMGR